MDAFNSRNGVTEAGTLASYYAAKLGGVVDSFLLPRYPILLYAMYFQRTTNRSIIMTFTEKSLSWFDIQSR
ncbi:MAG TPA: hypothetical protein VIX38_06765 [Nitrososphaeraceae archaeon]